MIAHLIRTSLLALCLVVPQGGHAKDAPAAASETPAPKPTSPSQTAARDRQQKCGAEWRALTDAQKLSQGPKWPQFWSTCNKRLKANDKA